MGTEFSLKTAVVSLFVEGLLDIDGDEKGKGLELKWAGVWWCGWVMVGSGRVLHSLNRLKNNV